MLYTANKGALQNDTIWFVIYEKSFILSHIQSVYLVYLLLSSVIEKEMKEKGTKMNKITEGWSHWGFFKICVIGWVVLGFGLYFRLPCLKKTLKVRKITKYANCCGHFSSCHFLINIYLEKEETPRIGDSNFSSMS